MNAALPAPPVRLLLVDDHGLFREGLSRLLADEPGLLLIAQCSSLEELRRMLTALPPAGQAHTSIGEIDLMLLDYDLGDHTAFHVLRAMRSLGFAGRVLLVTAGMGAEETARAAEAGVSGIFLKHSPPSELVRAIHQVMRDLPWPGRSTDHSSLQRLQAPSAMRPGSREARQTLTPRERAVLRGVFAGRANKEIAVELQLSEGSVKAVLQQLFAKTGVRTRAQLVRIALEHRYEYELETD